MLHNEMSSFQRNGHYNAAIVIGQEKFTGYETLWKSDAVWSPNLCFVGPCVVHDFQPVAGWDDISYPSYLLAACMMCIFQGSVLVRDTNS